MKPNNSHVLKEVKNHPSLNCQLLIIYQPCDALRNTVPITASWCCQVLKRLPLESLQTLLDMFNNMWEAGRFPEGWELATVVPIPEPGRDRAESTNCRPIALASCLCEALERVINAGLSWYLEIGNLMSPVRSGFRSERGTNGNLV